MHKIINMGMIAVLSIGTITAGEIKGRVKYIGKSPKAKRIRMDADPVCAASHQEAAKAESFVVDADGNMANVIVYLKGVEYNGETPSKEVIIDQKGCVYSPHVLGVQAGQPLKILNSDATMHNIHGLPKINNITKINDKSTVERSLNLKFLTFIKFLIFRFKLIFIPHIFLFF